MVTKSKIKHKNILPLRQNKIVSFSEQYYRVAAWDLNSISGKRQEKEKHINNKLLCMIKESKFTDLDTCIAIRARHLVHGFWKLIVILFILLNYPVQIHFTKNWLIVRISCLDYFLHLHLLRCYRENRWFAFHKL